MKTLNKLLVTRWNGKLLTALSSGGKVVQMNLEEDGNSILHRIYIGKVQNIVKNIDAAFVELGNGQIGYYSLTENKRHLFLSAAHQGPVKEGDQLIVQVERDAVKTKAPVLSCNLNFTGRYSVLTTGNHTLGFSSKIRDEAWKAVMKPLLLELKRDDYGIIIRTNAYQVPKETLLEEIQRLEIKKETLLSTAVHRTCFSVLYEEPPSYLTSIRDTYSTNLEEIVTDQEDCHRALSEYLSEYQPEDFEKLRHYQDDLLPLGKLYSLETAMDQALSQKVWLKSGGYLVIEPTEALTVIDVNTGKYSGRKNMSDTILKINLEAAREIAYQLRLRNLSGIIVVDFIDSSRVEDRELLMETLRQLVTADPVKTTVVDITKLNLVEITRKKVRKPFYEQV